MDEKNTSKENTRDTAPQEEAPDEANRQDTNSLKDFYEIALLRAREIRKKYSEEPKKSE
jgi:hypothetical protein